MPKPRTKPPSPRTPEGEEKERQRKKLANEKRKATAQSAAPTIERQVPIKDIDPAPAEAVRDFGPPDSPRGREEAAAVEDYADLYRSGKEKAGSAHQGPTKVYLSEGGRRLKASTLAGRDTLLCRVWAHATDAAAEAAAYREAGGSNMDHGLRRTADDKRAAVAALIVRPEYETTSDSELGRLCDVGHVLVRLVREALSHAGLLHGPAHAATRNYNPKAKLRANLVSDGKGNLIPDPDDLPKPPPEPVARPAVPEPEKGSGGWRATPVEELDLPDEVLATCRAEKIATAGDIHRKLVAGETLGLDDDALGGLLDLIDTVAGTRASPRSDDPDPDPPAGPDRDRRGRVIPDPLRKAFAADLPDLAAVDRPYCCCPHVDQTGTHPHGGTCKLCKGRGWLTERAYYDLSPELKAVCDGRPEPPRATTDEERALAALSAARQSLAVFRDRVFGVVGTTLRSALLGQAKRAGVPFAEHEDLAGGGHINAHDKVQKSLSWQWLDRANDILAGVEDDFRRSQTDRSRIETGAA